MPDRSNASRGIAVVEAAALNLEADE